jgi:hypothetical protein
VSGHGGVRVRYIEVVVVVVGKVGLVVLVLVAVVEVAVVVVAVAIVSAGKIKRCVAEWRWWWCQSWRSCALVCARMSCERWRRRWWWVVYFRLSRSVPCGDGGERRRWWQLWW